MTPWYRGFKGTITKKTPTTWVFEGVFDSNTSTVKELPPGKWIQDYKEYLENLTEQGKIRGYENHSTENEPNFLVEGSIAEDDMKLTTNIHTSNMYLVTPDGSLKKYETPEEILVDYARVRMSHYKLRKKHIVKSLSDELERLAVRMKFIQLVMNGTLEIFRKSRASIEQNMKLHGILEKFWDECLSTKTYSYTSEELEKLNTQIENTQSELSNIQSMTIANMWENDILTLD
jgi:DNA topoisomerase-2